LVGAWRIVRFTFSSAASSDLLLKDSMQWLKQRSTRLLYSLMLREGRAAEVRIRKVPVADLELLDGFEEGLLLFLRQLGCGVQGNVHF